MPKALIISYYWPPAGGGGVQRWLKFVKYMRTFGWEPIVYTPENGEFPEEDLSLLHDVPKNIEVIKTPIVEPYNAYKSFIGQKKDEKIKTAFMSENKKNSFTENIAVWIRGNFFIPDARKFWVKPSVKFLKTYLKENPVDVIITTGPPHSMHLIGQQLRKITSIPWLADFRDPWTKIDFYDDLKLTKLADKKHHRLEYQVLKDADRVITIGSTLGVDFKTIVDRDYDIITNGYDDADFDETKDRRHETTGGFSIVHVGSLSKSRNPELLWKVLAEKVSLDNAFADKLEIRIVGKADYSVFEAIKENKLEKYLTRVGYLPHDKVVGELKSAAILLLLINDTPSSKMILTGKFFEYLSAKRPILCIGPVDGDAANILKETRSGLVSDFKDKETLNNHIDTYFQQFKNNSLKVESSDYEKYNRKNLTKHLCQVLDELVADS